MLVPGVGKEVNGSRRWISLIIINFQPSELVKLFTVMYASDYVLRKSKQMRKKYTGEDRNEDTRSEVSRISKGAKKIHRDNKSEVSSFIAPKNYDLKLDKNGGL